MGKENFRRALSLIILLIILLLPLYLSRTSVVDIERLKITLKAAPLFYSGLSFIGLYVFLTFFIFFLKDIFWLMAALLFGPFISTLLILAAETINAFILFYLSRRLGRGYVKTRLTDKYRRLDEKLGNINFLWLLLLRAAPLIPYRFLDLAAGLTRINLGRYLAAVILGSWPKIFWIQYILSAVGKNVYSPALLAGYFLQNKNILLFGWIYIILVIVVALKLKNK